jgi:hypothetical protein
MELAEQFKASFKALGLEEPDLPHGIVLDGFDLVLATRRHLMTRHVLAATSWDKPAQDWSSLRNLLQDARNSLTRSLAQPPWWKELSSILVVPCTDSFLDQSPTSMRLHDRTGLHMNVILGVFLVNPSVTRFSATHPPLTGKVRNIFSSAQSTLEALITNQLPHD